MNEGYTCLAGYMSHKRDMLLGIYVYWAYLFIKNYKEAILRIETYCTLLKYIDYMIARCARP